MSREDLKDIIRRVLDRLQDESPTPACLFGDSECDMTTKYAVNEEA